MIYFWHTGFSSDKPSFTGEEQVVKNLVWCRTKRFHMQSVARSFNSGFGSVFQSSFVLNSGLEDGIRRLDISKVQIAFHAIPRVAGTFWLHLGVGYNFICVKPGILEKVELQMLFKTVFTGIFTKQMHLSAMELVSRCDTAGPISLLHEFYSKTDFVSYLPAEKEKTDSNYS